MNLFQQYQIELSKAKKELAELQIKIRFNLTEIAERANPFLSSTIEEIKTDEIVMLAAELSEVQKKAVDLIQKIKNIERELNFT